MKKILILGGGFGGVEAYKRLHKLFHPCAEKGVIIELVNRNNYFTFTPMLHEAATGSVSREHVIQPLRELTECCGNVFHRGDVVKIDIEGKEVTTDRKVYGYDILVLALGSKAGLSRIMGAGRHGYSLKTLADAVDIRNCVIRSYEDEAERVGRKNDSITRKNLSFVVIGGGASGVELCGQLADMIRLEIKRLYPEVRHELAQVIVVHDQARLLNRMSRKVSNKALDRLRKLGVAVRLDQKVVRVERGVVVLSSGERMPARNVFWTVGTESSLKGLLPDRLLDERGLMATDKYREAKCARDVWAVGDCAVVNDRDYRVPPTAQAAVWEAELAARNIQAELEGKKKLSKKFRSKGSIVPIGDWYAIFEWGRIVMTGRLAWWLRRMVFLMTMYGGGDKLRIVSDWIIRIFQPRDTSEF